LIAIKFAFYNLSTSSHTMSSVNQTPAQSTRKLIGEKSMKPLYLDHPDLVAQVRALDANDPDKDAKYEVIKTEAQRRHDVAKAQCQSKKCDSNSCC
jgi:hypothetical protein